MLHLFTGTLVTHCDSCHNEATCLESPGRGDSFINHRLSCVCKDGFVGDGITCYNTELCSDSSCCSQGYHWSAESGCVDIDECSLPDSPCPLPQVCQNTPGSFECLQPSSSTRSGPSSRSIVFDCGHTICPAGTDCVVGSDGIMTCVDPCETYIALNEDWRSINNTSTQDPNCDSSFNGKTWYRFFLWQTSAHIPERCVGRYRCGTTTPLWISTPHPTKSDVIESRTACGHRWDNCCGFENDLYVKFCDESFYVYRLYNARICDAAYCAGIVPSEIFLQCNSKFNFILSIYKIFFTKGPIVIALCFTVNSGEQNRACSCFNHTLSKTTYHSWWFYSCHHYSPNIQQHSFNN